MLTIHMRMLLKMRLYRVEGNMSKKLFFRKLNWYIEGKWQIWWGIAFDLGTLHTSSHLTLTAAQEGWYFYSNFTKKGTFSEALNNLKMTWLFSQGPCPDSNWCARLQSSWKKEMGLVHVHGEISLIFVPEACPLLKPTKCYIQGLSQMSYFEQL